MRIPKANVVAKRHSWLLAIVACCSVVNAQSILQGQNSVYNSAATTTGSVAFFDASMFALSPPPTNRNLCAVLNFILNPANTIIPPTGAVVDARGLNSTNTSLNCTSSPWSGITSPPASTILLPAATITTSAIWILPSNTRLIGEGDGVPLSGAVGTTIQASSSSFSGPLLQFGSSSICPGTPAVCSGISVEDLTLDGDGGTSVIGIQNQYSQNNTFVDHVGLYQILGTGLLVESGADGSGPYTNIRFDTGGDEATTTTECVSLNNLTSTQGVRGLSCLSATNDAPAAVLLDSSNTSIEDVRIVGFYDGIRIGANANARSNVLAHIIGDTSQNRLHPTPVNAIHIENAAHTVTDLSIMGVSNSGLMGTYTIQDDVTGPHLSDTSIAIYAIGETVPIASGGINGYTRYTTSPNVANWSVGTSAPSGGCTSATRGAIYSCAGTYTSCCVPGTSCTAATADVLWVCGNTGAWLAID